MSECVKWVVIVSALLLMNHSYANDRNEPENRLLECSSYEGGVLKASLFHDHVYLYWSALGDLGSFSVSVEYSVDAVDWIPVNVSAKDMYPEVGAKYQFVDKRRSIGRNFYRVQLSVAGETQYSTIANLYLNECDGPLAVRSCSKHSLTFSVDESVGSLTKAVSLLDEAGHKLGYVLQENKGIYTIRIEEGTELVGDYTLKICTEKGLYTSHIHVN